jgi:hypothetical protein
MADSSSTQLFYRPENNWGETPSARSPQLPLREFRFTNESLNYSAQTTISEEIRSDRQVSDIIRTGVETGGDVGIEFSFGAHDDLFEGALYNDWSAEQDSQAAASPAPLTFTIQGSPAGSQIGVGSPTNGGAAFLDGLTVGAFIEITGSTLSPENNGYYRVVSHPSAGIVEVTPALPSVGVDTIRIRESHLRNGTTLKSFLLEKAFTDVSEYIHFTGMRVGSMQLNIAPGSILNGQFSFQGENAVAQGTSIIAGLTSPESVAVAANDVFNAVDNIGDVLIDGAVDPDVCFTELSFTVENNLRFQPCIGQLESSGIGVGRTQVSGTVAAYFVNRNFYERYLNFTTTSLSFTVSLGGNTYLIDFPSFKFTNGEVVAAGNDQDVLVNMEFTAKRDPTYGFTMGMNRYGDIPAVVA